MNSKKGDPQNQVPYVNGKFLWFAFFGAHEALKKLKVLGRCHGTIRPENIFLQWDEWDFALYVPDDFEEPLPL